MDRRTPVVLVAGERDGATRAAAALVRPGTVVVTYDTADAQLGLVTRMARAADSTAPHRELLNLVGGCVSCTVRADLLPLLRRLGARHTVERIVVVLDPAFEPQPVCWAIENTVVSGIVGQLDGPAAREVRVKAVLTCIDAATWLDDATSDDVLAQLLPDCDPLAGDDRTVAQVAVAQVAYADALLVSGTADGPQLGAVLARLAPTAVIGDDAEKLVGAVPYVFARGSFDDPHGPLLRGQPPLHSEHGIALVEFTANRPFQPQRLHEALDVLLDGVVTARGRIWLATQPDTAQWLESAGGGLRVGHAGKWLAAMTSDELVAAPLERRAMAALRWDERFGDRDISLVILVHDADPADIERALRWALVTDDELAHPRNWPDPFGAYHQDPCVAKESLIGDAEREEHS